VADVLDDLKAAVVIEDYPDAERGSSVLVLQKDATGAPIHVLWGVGRGQLAPAVMITAYRPDPRRWSTDLMRRMKP
jgi:hypothetical protein